MKHYKWLIVLHGDLGCYSDGEINVLNFTSRCDVNYLILEGFKKKVPPAVDLKYEYTTATNHTNES